MLRLFTRIQCFVSLGFGREYLLIVFGGVMYLLINRLEVLLSQREKKMT